MCAKQRTKLNVYIFVNFVNFECQRYFIKKNMHRKTPFSSSYKGLKLLTEKQTDHVIPKTGTDVGSFTYLSLILNGDAPRNQ